MFQTNGQEWMDFHFQSHPIKFYFFLVLFSSWSVTVTCNGAPNKQLLLMRSCYPGGLIYFKKSSVKVNQTKWRSEILPPLTITERSLSFSSGHCQIRLLWMNYWRIHIPFIISPLVISCCLWFWITPEICMHSFQTADGLAGSFTTKCSVCPVANNS